MKGGRGDVDSNFTAGWEDTQSAPGAPAYTQCLIAVNCGAVFSTQTNLGLAALTTGRVFLGGLWGRMKNGADVRVSVCFPLLSPQCRWIAEISSTKPRAHPV